MARPRKKVRGVIQYRGRVYARVALNGVLRKIRVPDQDTAESLYAAIKLRQRFGTPIPSELVPLVSGIDGLSPVVKEETNPPRLVCDVLSEYMHAKAHAKSKGDITRRLVFWSFCLGEVPLDGMARERMAALVRSIEDARQVLASHGLSQGSIGHYLTALRSAFNYAERSLGLIDPNDNPFHRRIKIPKSPARKVRISFEEFALLVRAAPPLARAVLVFAACSARRIGEILTLDRSAVRLDHSTRSGQYYCTPEKNGEAGWFPINRLAYEVLTRMPRFIGEDRRVFPVSRWYISHAFKRAARRIGRDDLHLHDLRHAAASWLGAETNSKYVQAFLGQKTPAMTARYTHPQDAEMRALGEKISDGLMGAGISGDDLDVSRTLKPTVVALKGRTQVNQGEKCPQSVPRDVDEMGQTG